MAETFKDPPLVKLFRGCFQNCLPILNDKTSEGVQNEAVLQVLNDVDDDVREKKSFFVPKKETAVTSLPQCVEDLQNDKKIEKTEVQRSERVSSEAMDSSEPDQIGDKNGEEAVEEDEEKGGEFEETFANEKTAVAELRLSSQSMSPTASDGESMLLEKEDAHSELLTNGMMYDRRSDNEYACTSRDAYVDRDDVSSKQSTTSASSDDGDLDDVSSKQSTTSTSSDDGDRDDVCAKQSVTSTPRDGANSSACKSTFSVALTEMESACRVFCEDVYGQLGKLGNPKEIDRRLQALDLRQNSDVAGVDNAVCILERVVGNVLLHDFFKFQEEPLLKDSSDYRRECLEEFERLSDCYDKSLLKTDVSRKAFKKLTVEYFRKHEQFEGDVSFKQFTQEKNCALKLSVEGLIDDIPDLKKREIALHSILGTDLSNKRITVHYLSLCKSVWRLRWLIQSTESTTEIAEMTKAIHSAKM